MSQLKAALQQLASGGIISIPTETVYGLAVDAENVEAIERLYACKARPEHKPLAIALQNPEDIERWVTSITPDTRILIAAFWPGPLTLVLPAKPHVSTRITAGKNTIGIRCSSAPLLQAIIHEFGKALCLTSANISGQTDLCTPENITEQFGQEIYVLTEEQPASGKPSTVLDLTCKPYRLLREGNITKHMLEALLQTTITS